ncbi:MAG: alkaline phosphatase family protein [Bacteroidia bacterium]|nr:alkaline phosphatase family protein [Bacteroidia bacterium]MDW8016000.1 alkaline phosphatase family protein [Bacteroidia bacterium]
MSTLLGLKSGIATLFFLYLVAGNPYCTYAQNPRLVVGIVVDQMRADYLRRFIPKRSTGFRRLLEEGIVYWNCHYVYFPTYTAPGHASIYTGATPAYHGIVGNTWYERQLGRPYYCVLDTTVQPIGTSSKAAQRSPRMLQASTITDELRYASRFQSKVIGIALKDRAAILPAGRAGTLALWFDSREGLWVTSSYYTDTLPEWVMRFNQRRYPDSLLRLDWTLPSRLICQDESLYEGTIGKNSTTRFPHRPTSYEELLLTPAGNWLTFRLAQEAIESERLGRHRTTDFLALSLSSPDLAGHLFGTESCELEALYHELDRQLGLFLDYLARRFKKEEILVFLTADHGAAPTPEILAEKGFGMGRFPEKALLEQAQAYLRAQLGLPESLSPIAAFLNQNFYLAEWLSPAQKREAARLLKSWLMTQPHVIWAYTSEELSGGGSTFYAFEMVQAGFFASRCGEVIVIYAPGWLDSENYSQGTTHGSIWTYDTHVPLIWWGGGLRAQSFYERVPITAIAPTLAFILRAPLPSTAFTPPLPEVIQQWRLPPLEVQEQGVN